MIDLKKLKRMSALPKQVKSLRGKKMNIPSLFSKPSKKDWDGDGIPNFRDCQPRNIMRQDLFTQIHHEGYKGGKNEWNVNVYKNPTRQETMASIKKHREEYPNDTGPKTRTTQRGNCSRIRNKTKERIFLKNKKLGFRKILGCNHYCFSDCFVDINKFNLVQYKLRKKRFLSRYKCQ